MKKHIYLFLALFFANGYLLSAQDPYANMIDQVESFVDFAKKIFGPLILASFLFFFIINLNYFRGENADWGKGLGKILIYTAIITVGVSIVGYIGTIIVK